MKKALCYFLAFFLIFTTDKSALAATTVGFTGEDQTQDSVYLRDRYYDPTTGTFLTKDPLGVAGGLNAYQYAGSNPPNQLDPQGNFWFLAVGLLAVFFLFSGPSTGTANAPGPNDPIGNSTNTHSSLELPLTVAGPVLAPIAGATVSYGISKVSPLFTTVSADGSTIVTDALDELVPTAGSIRNVNPEGGDMNCVNCAIATDLTLQGIPAVAPLSGAQPISVLEEMYGGEFADVSGPMEIGSILSNAGDGARGIVFGGLESGDPGHVFNVVLQDGTVRFLDGQAGGLGIENFESFDYFQFLPTNFSLATETTLLDQGETISLDGGGFLSLDVGGVLINQAATLVGGNLSDIQGVTYDPVTKQLIFLGPSTFASAKAINMDYFYTAIQATYGSAVPPFVTINMPVNPFPTWMNFTTTSDGTLLRPGQTGGFSLLYDPAWPNVDHSVAIRIRAHDASNHQYDFSYNLTAAYGSGYYLPGSTTQSPMLLYYSSTTGNNGSSVPSGLTLDTSPFTQTSLQMTPAEPTFTSPNSNEYEEATYPVRIYNNSGGNITIDTVMVIPDQQHRVYGGRVDGTKLGWVMYEADRVMKCLAIGKDDLTGITYSSTQNTPVSGFHNVVELAANYSSGSNFSRLWFEPNQMTLQSSIDPTTGKATVSFSSATVQLLTQAQIAGQAPSPEDTAFVNFFNANYSAFAAQNFTVMDPTDPTNTRTISVPIFAMLQQAMQAVSLARFFHDNNIPVDMSWMTSYTPPNAYTLKSVPTAFNSGPSGSTIIFHYGGVQINKPNSYVPSSSAATLGQNVLSARPSPASGAPQDIPGQSWSVGSNSLSAVAASLSTDSQNGDVNLTETDLSFTSPGDLALTFKRYYHSNYTGNGNLGPGWSYPRYVLQFTNPSWYDQTHLMVDGSGHQIQTDAKADTRLRSGTVRMIDLQTQAKLDFQSSLNLAYSTDSLGNPVATITGLATGDIPTFTAGSHQNAATLTQTTDTNKNYVLTFADGAYLLFDSNGNLLQITDRHGYSKYYAYNTTGQLSTISDNLSPTPQTITLSYATTSPFYLQTAVGPQNEGVTYHYDTSSPPRLISVVNNRSAVPVARYTYNNTTNQLVAVTRMDGTTPVTTSADLKGRSSTRTDARGNTTSWTYTKNSTDLSTVTTTYDPNSGVGTWEMGRDSNGRRTYVKNPLNYYTTYGYTGASLAPNQVQLPTPGRPAISIYRNAAALPTQVTDPGIANSQPITIQYTSANLPTHITDTSGRATDIYYTASNNLQTLRNYHNSQNVDTVLGYQNEFLHSVADPLGHTWTYDHDSAGRVTKVTDPTGVAIKYDYDSLGRLWHVYDPRHDSTLTSPTITYTYDNLDRVTDVTTPVGTTHTNYDPVTTWADQTTQTTSDGQITSVQYSYDTVGDVTSAATTYQLPASQGGGTQTDISAYNYTPYGDLQTVFPPGAEGINFTVNSLGQFIGASETNTKIDPLPIISASQASDAVWSTINSQIFTWTAAPNSYLTPIGYNYSQDGPTSLSVNTTGTTVTWANIADGQHTFRVRTKYSDGSWSGESVFNLWVDSTPPNISAGITPTPLSGGIQTVSINANVSDYLSNGIDGLIQQAGAANSGTSVNGTFLGGNMDLFTAVNDTTGTYTRNSNIWTGSLDFSGVSVYQSSGGTFATGATLVTPTDAVVAHHASPPVGAVLSFVDNNNTVYKATVSAVVNVSGDLSIAHLVWTGTTPTTLRIYRVLPANYATILPSSYLSNFAIIGVNQFRQVFCQDAGATPFSFGTFSHTLSTEANRAPFSLNVVGGDSSYPLFEVINGDPVLLGANFSTSAAPSVGDNIAAVNAAIASFSGDTYSLCTYTQNNFNAPTFSGVTGTPQFSWCISSDNTRNWSAYAPMTLVNGQWIGTFTEDGSKQTLYYQVQAQDVAGNTATWVGSSPLGVTPLQQNYGFAPASKPLIGGDGNFYVENTSGGAYNNGTIVKITPSGQATLLYTFTNTDGSAPIGGLVQAADGNFYGVTSGGTVIYQPEDVNFGNTLGDLGTGGPSYFKSQGISNYGTVFRLTPSGTLTTLATFNSTNGAQPNGLIVASNGIMYGTTYSGGSSGYGTLFSLTTGGVFTTLANFTGTNGINPIGNLVQNTDGNLYGATYGGGQSQGGGLSSYGTLFKTSASTSQVAGSSTISTLYSFGGIFTGNCPLGNLIHDSQGNLYGLVANGAGSGGQIFKWSNQGQYSNIIYNIETYTPGGLTLDSGGNYYIPVFYPSSSYIEKFTSSGTQSVFYSFGNNDGQDPLAGLIQDGSGAFYGTNSVGGASGGGTLFKITAGGTYTVLFSFAPNPIISAQPAPLSAAVGQPTTFSVSAFTPVYPYTQIYPNTQTPTYPLSYQWLKNGTPIPGANGATYSITSPTTSDVGTYSVYITNAVGTVTSNAVGLTVTNPPVITSQPVSQTVNEFQAVAFSITAYGQAPLSYQWQQAPAGSTTHTNLNDGPFIAGSESPTLTVTPFSLAQTGESFRCVVTNASGIIASDDVTLNISEPLQTIKAGGPATFTVTPPGSGPFTYQWQFNGTNIPGATNSTYSIGSASPSNTGTYTAIVTGDGNFTATFELNVTPPDTNDTPTMPPWMLIILAILLCLFATRPMRRTVK